MALPCCIWAWVPLSLCLSLKPITHLPPYVGMMLSLAVVATFAEIYSNAKFAISSAVDDEHHESSHHSPVHSALDED